MRRILWGLGRSLTSQVRELIAERGEKGLAENSLCLRSYSSLFLPSVPGGFGYGLCRKLKQRTTSIIVVIEWVCVVGLFLPHGL